MVSSVTAGGFCPLCGAPHATCGLGLPAVPVDRLTTIPKGDPVLKRYRTTVNGHATTLKLSAADAKDYPGELTEISEGETSETPEAAEGDEAETKSRRTPANKARGAQSDRA